MARVIAGDQKAFSALYERHQPLVAQRLRRILRSDVEDVLQVTFVEAYRSLRRYDPERPFAPWISGIAIRQAASHLRRARRRSWLKLSFSGDDLQIPDPRPALDDQANQRQLAGLLFAAMEGLPTNKRIAFSLHALEGLSLTEVGELMGASPQTTRARVMSAREAVLKRLRKAGRSHDVGLPGPPGENG
ncbi:MAG: RNA polymerase sigma factor [Deltaproteobacteria bacterium]|nr:RNA polymerase sigma factor [Deltaproteobacteria bacterium]